MRDFGSFGSSLNFARYRGVKGFISRLHPGSKLVILSSGIVVITIAGSATGLLSLVTIVLLVAGCHGLSPGKMLKPLVPIAPYLLLVLLLQGLSLPREPGEALLSRHDLLPVAITGLRILALMSLLGFFSAVLTTSQVSYGVESLLAPFGRIGVPAAELGLIATITFRFIPFLREESERLAKAQTARGGSLGHRSPNPLRRMRASLPTLVPLFVGTLRKAEILAESMHLRGYSERGLKTRLRRFHFTGTDLISLTGAGLSAAIAIGMGAVQTDTLLINFLWRILV